MQTASDRLLDEQYWTEWRASNVSLCQCQFFQPYSPPAKRRAGGNMKTVQSITTICLTALLLLASAFVPAKAEDQAGKAANYVYLPIVGNLFGAPPPPEIKINQITSSSGNCWDAEEDPGRDGHAECVPAELVSSVGVRTVPGTFAPTTAHGWESDQITVEVAMLPSTTLNLGSPSAITESGNIQISAYQMLPLGSDPRGTIMQARQAGGLIRAAENSIMGLPLHQSTLLWAGLDTPPTTNVMTLCPQKVNKLYWFDYTPVQINMWRSSHTTGNIYAQLGLVSECPAASGMWVFVGNLWIDAVARHVVTNDDLGPDPTVSHVTVPVYQGSTVTNVAMTAAVVVIGAIVIIVLFPEVAAVLAGASGWMLVGNIISTCAGGPCSAEEKEKEKVVNK